MPTPLENLRDGIKSAADAMAAVPLQLEAKIAEQQTALTEAGKVINGYVSELESVRLDRDAQLKVIDGQNKLIADLRKQLADKPTTGSGGGGTAGNDATPATRVPTAPKLTPVNNPLFFASLVRGNVDGRGGIYTGSLSINGGTVSNAQLNITSNSGVEMDGGTLTDCIVLPGSKAGITARGKSPKINRVIIPDVGQYPIMFDGADEFEFSDIDIADTQWQSNIRWAHSSGVIQRVRVRADGKYSDADPKTPDVNAANRATGRGDTIGKGVRYIDCDIEAPTATHGAGNPLGGGSDSGDGAQGIGIKQFRLGKGWWYAANAAECLKAANALSTEKDRRVIIRACMKVALDKDGKKYPGGSDDDVNNTLSDRDVGMRSNGLATHTNTRLVVNGIGTECNGSMRFDETCELELNTLLREIHTAYPIAPWKMPNDLTRSAPSIILTGTKVTTKNGLGCTDAEAALILAGSDFSLNGKRVVYAAK